MELYFEHRVRRPVAAVIFTHTHTDHWGGARGVIDDAMLASGGFRSSRPICSWSMRIGKHHRRACDAAPRAVSVRAFLKKGPRGQVDCGLGKSMAAARWRCCGRPT